MLVCYKIVTAHIKEHRPPVIYTDHCGGPQNKHFGRKTVGYPNSCMKNGPTEVFSAVKVFIKWKKLWGMTLSNAEKSVLAERVPISSQLPQSKILNGTALGNILSQLYGFVSMLWAPHFSCCFRISWFQDRSCSNQEFAMDIKSLNYLCSLKMPIPVLCSTQRPCAGCRLTYALSRKNSEMCSGCQSIQKHWKFKKTQDNVIARNDEK